MTNRLNLVGLSVVTVEASLLTEGVGLSCFRLLSLLTVVFGVVFVEFESVSFSGVRTSSLSWRTMSLVKSSE